MDATAINGLLFVIAGLVVWLAYLGERQTKRHLAQRMQAKFVEFDSFVKQLQQSRAIPFIEASTLQCAEGEFVILACNSRMYEYRSQLIAVNELRSAGEGTLYLTNRRLAFVGTGKNFTTPLAMLLCIDNAGEYIAVSSDGSTPVMFSVPNGYYWWGLARLLTKMDLESRRLPDGVDFMAALNSLPGTPSGHSPHHWRGHGGQLPSNYAAPLRFSRH